MSLVIIIWFFLWCLLLVCVSESYKCLESTGCEECNLISHENISSHMEQNEYDLIQDRECLICMNTMKIEDIERLRCQHIFHRECLLTWMEIRQNCPLCRKKECCIRIND